MSYSHLTFRNVVKRAIADSDTIYNMVDGNIEEGLPEDQLQSKLSDTHQSVISVAYPQRFVKGAGLGSANHKTKETISHIRVDVASLYNNSDVYCAEIIEAIENLIVDDLDYILGNDFHKIFVSQLAVFLNYNTDIKAWHGTIDIGGRYWYQHE